VAAEGLRARMSYLEQRRSAESGPRNPGMTTPFDATAHANCLAAVLPLTSAPGYCRSFGVDAVTCLRASSPFQSK
jgi:hypothetical protein